MSYMFLNNNGKPQKVNSDTALGMLFDRRRVTMTGVAQRKHVAVVFYSDHQIAPEVRLDDFPDILKSSITEPNYSATFVKASLLIDGRKPTLKSVYALRNELALKLQFDFDAGLRKPMKEAELRDFVLLYVQPETTAIFIEDEIREWERL